jgi:hypothetical protein
MATTNYRKEAMNGAKFTYTDEASGVEFQWHGGAYIDIGSTYAMGEAGVNGDDFHAYDVINVWDYEKDEPRIPRTLDAFQERCNEWLQDHADEN